MKTTTKILDKLMSVVAIVLIVILSIVLIGNIVFIIKGSEGGDLPPKVLGVMPLIVTSSSMDGDNSDSFAEGSMIFVRESDGIEQGDIVTYLTPSSRNEGFIIVTHRVIEIYDENGTTYCITKGDANNAADQTPITTDMVVGEYWFHIAELGRIALFMKEPLGMLLCIGLPILIFVGYDLIKKQRSEKRKASNTAAMQAELDRLRALAGETAEITATPEAEEAPTVEDTPEAVDIPANPEAPEANPQGDAS